MGVSDRLKSGGNRPKILIGTDEIQRRVSELGALISDHHLGHGVLLIGVLNGAFVFLADLIRHITVRTSVDFLAVSSYGDRTTSSGLVRVLKDIEADIAGQDVVIVEDIVDSGRTLSAIQRMLRDRSPASLETCVLLSKPARREVEVQVEYCGFTIPDRFVVGYGLDSAGLYRNLDYIGVVET